MTENEQTVAGLVYDPNRDECFQVLKGMGSYLNQQALNRLNDEPSLLALWPS